MKLYYRRFDRSLSEAISLIEGGGVKEGLSKLREALESYRHYSQLYLRGERFERGLYNRFRRGGVVFKSEHSFGGVDLIVFGRAPKVKLVECKLSSRDLFYVLPEDYARLHERYHQLKRRGFEPEPVIVVGFPHRRRRRAVRLRDEWMDARATLRVEYSAKSRRVFVRLARSRRGGQVATGYKQPQPDRGEGGLERGPLREAPPEVLRGSQVNGGQG